MPRPRCWMINRWTYALSEIQNIRKMQPCYLTFLQTLNHTWRGGQPCTRLAKTIHCSTISGQVIYHVPLPQHSSPRTMLASSTSRRSGSACRCQALCTVRSPRSLAQTPVILAVSLHHACLDNRKEPNGPQADVRMDNDQRKKSCARTRRFATSANGPRG